MSQPECLYCGEDIEDGETCFSISDQTVHRDELQLGAGGGTFHPDCAKDWIDDYMNNRL